ncbi:MAG: tetratricopeptide repeat protein [Labilithrix sp.]|nr:tetratricopeptide repeat protein [Labilithrix sp.]
MTRDDQGGAADAGGELDRTLRRAFSDELAPRDDDDARIEAAIGRTLGAPRRARRGPLHRSLVYLVAAALAVGALAYAAGHRETGPSSSSTDIPTTAPSPVAEGPSRVSPPLEPVSAVPPPAEVASPESLPAASAPVTRPSLAAAPASAKSAGELAPETPSLGAAGLFALANEARRANETKRAITLYEELQTRFPGSREASTSRVALGRLLLDRADEPARARAAFDRYLADEPSGSLAEEARAGRALALMRLGDRAGEAAAWLELLERHPGSLHAERARQRLVDLGN